MKYSPKYFTEFKKRYPKVANSFDQLGAECALILTVFICAVIAIGLSFMGGLKEEMLGI